MPRDKKILYVLAALCAAGLFPIAMLDSHLCGIVAAIWLGLAALVALLWIKKRRAPSIHRKTVLLLMLIFALTGFTLFYLSGLWLGFVKNTVPFSITALFRTLLPAATIIVASELLRRVLLSQEDRAASALSFLIALLGELCITGGLADFSHFNALMDTVALSLLPAISAGTLYHFVSARHGALPCIATRLLLLFVPYWISISPDIPDVLVAFAAILLPLVLLLFLRLLFEKQAKRATASPRKKWVGLISALLSLVLVTAVMALVSGQFHYNTIVIATPSMTGELNVGDAIVYERYEGQDIGEGDIIIFQRDRAHIVHRVVEITHVNGETRYYTKGDANENRDAGFITKNDIVGITDFKISGIGYASLWMRRIFESGS